MKINSLLSALLAVIILTTFATITYAQSYQAGTVHSRSVFQWPEGKKMALSLTFDDARLSQPDLGIPLLDKYGIKATFYVSPDNMIQRVDAWKKQQ